MKFVFRASFFLFIFFLLSCKKDKKDTQPPVITWVYPSVGQHFNMFDTMTVNASVVDNNHLSYINVVLTDINHTPLQASYSVPITSAGFTFNLRYVLNQYHLQTGNYLMQITADDGYNTVASYQPIYITESPTLFWGVCMVFKNNLHVINQVQFDALGALIPISTINLSQAYNGMKYGGYYQQLYVNGKGSMPFQSFYLQPQSANQLAYSASATVSQIDYTTLYTDGTKPYVGYLNDDIYSFDVTGAYSTSYRLGDPNFYPYCFTKTSGNYGLGVFKSKISGHSDKIVSFHSLGASFNSSVLPITNFTVVAMFEKGQDSVYIFGNDAYNHAHGYIYYVPGNNFVDSLQYMSTTTGKLSSAVYINNDRVVFSIGSYTYLYSYSIKNQITSVHVSAQKLVYQPKLNQLTLANNTSGTGVLAFYTVNPTSLPLTRWPISCGDSIVDFEVITNK